MVVISVVVGMERSSSCCTSDEGHMESIMHVVPAVCVTTAYGIDDLIWYTADGMTRYRTMMTVILAKILNCGSKCGGVWYWL